MDPGPILESPVCCPCTLQPVWPWDLGYGAPTVSGGSMGITSTRSHVRRYHIPRDSPAAAFMLCLVRKQDKQRVVLELAGNWEAPGSLFWGVFPLFGGFPLWRRLVGAEGRVKKQNFSLFFFFFFQFGGVFCISPQPLWSSPAYFFFPSLHAPAKCFPVCLSLRTWLNHWTVYPQCGHCILTDILILKIYFFLHLS